MTLRRAFYVPSADFAPGQIIDLSREQTRSTLHPFRGAFTKTLGGKLASSSLSSYCLALDPACTRLTMLIVNGFDEPLADTYDLICSIYHSSDDFAASLAEVFPDLPAFTRYREELRNRPGSVFLLAKQEANLAGYLMLKPRPIERLSHGADLNMGILSSYRGLGVGQRLLERACAIAIDEGHLEILYLMVRADNLGALRLYEKTGFIQQARLNHDTKIDGRYFDGILMSKDVKQF